MKNPQFMFKIFRAQVIMISNQQKIVIFFVKILREFWRPIICLKTDFGGIDER